MRIFELFYSLQGEGVRAGEPSVFIRVAGCSAKFACAEMGVACDTEFEGGRDLSIDAVLAEARAIGGAYRWIVWTGGEPTDQLTPEIVAVFTAAGYRQQIETSGIRPVPLGVDLVTVSPKVAEHILAKHFPLRADGFHVDEVKYVRHTGQAIPEPALRGAGAVPLAAQ